MKRASTPTNEFTLPEGLDVSEIKYIRVTYAQGGAAVITKTEADVTIEDGSVFCRLSQEDTNALRVGTVEVQLRIVTKNGDSMPGKLHRVPVERVLNDEVLV